MGALCKDVQCLVLQVLCGDQLRFSLCSGAIITRCWFQFISYLLVSSPAQLMQSHASHLLPSLLRGCSCLLFLPRSPLVLQLFCCVCLSTVLAFCSLFYTAHILQCKLGYLVCTVHVGIACLAFSTCDWSQLHAGIACLAYDWVTACWDSLSTLLHAGIMCLASLAYDWVTVCWDSLSVFSMPEQHV